MKQCFHSIFFTIAFLTTISFLSHAGTLPVPFFPGEKLAFRVQWSFIPAGEVLLEILPMEILNGIESYHFKMTARNYAYIDPFYMVRDRIDAFTDADMTHTIRYEKRQSGKSKRKVTVQFDWKKDEAQYAEIGGKRKPLHVPPGSFDPLSIFYFFRLFDLEKSREIEVSVTDGKRWVLGKAAVLKKEKIEVASGVYDTYLVETDFRQIGGVFKKKKDAKLQIWVSADKWRIPVRVKSQVAVGSFVAELVSFEQGEAINKE
jgi:hypothetical protein